MRNLEDEFKKLIEGVRAKIEEKKLAGELADDEAAILNDMVTDRVNVDGWYNSDCYEEDYSSDDGWYSSRC
jgi:hypothetical protein